VKRLICKSSDDPKIDGLKPIQVWIFSIFVPLRYCINLISIVKSLFRTSDRIDVTDGIHLTVIDYPDAASLVRYLNDEVFFQNTSSIPNPYTLVDANAFISSVLEFEKKNGVQRDWAIRNPQGEQIGGIGLLYGHGLKSHRSEMGYWLGKPFWNRGIMTEVVKKFTEYIFSQTAIIRLEAMVFENNPASCQVLEKAGFTKEGFLHGVIEKDGQYLNAHLYGLVSDV
jgi:[ribosomal protein S5]-alanine N-acetyltransferase